MSSSAERERGCDANERADRRIALALYGVLTVFIVGSVAAVAYAGAQVTVVSQHLGGNP